MGFELLQFIQHGHQCDMNYERNALWKYFPGYTRWACFNRYIYKFLIVSEVNERSHLTLRSQAAILQEKIRHLRDFKSTIHPYSDLT